MNEKEFKENIIYDELAKTGLSFKYMLKSYLSILLKGGKIREKIASYSLGKISDEMAIVFSGGFEEALKIDKQKCETDLVNLFNKMVKEKKWVVKTTEIMHYDNKGKLLDEEELYSTPEPIVSKIIENKKIITYFIDDSLDIEPLIKNDT